jgi:predicted amidohydrolase
MLTVALAQMDVRTGQPEANEAKARTFAAQAQEAEANLLVFPELWLHGYDLERAEDWASPLGEGGFSCMADMARQHGLYVSGTGLERHAEGVSNTSVLYGPDGALVGFYRKIHLFPLMGEPRYLVAGDRATVCETDWGAIGLTICYDLRFPELYRTLALAGASLVLIPAQWPEPRLEAWLLLARARAIENELFVAACNRVGEQGISEFPGRSAVIDPWGKALVEGDDQERLLVAGLEKKEIRRARRYLTVFEDRRPEAYHVGRPGWPASG